MEKKKDIGALWLKESKTSGMKFMAGKINGVEVVIFKNTYKKEGSKEPDYRVYPSDDRQAPAPTQPQADMEF